MLLLLLGYQHLPGLLLLVKEALLLDLCLDVWVLTLLDCRGGISNEIMAKPEGSSVLTGCHLVQLLLLLEQMCLLGVQVLHGVSGGTPGTWRHAPDHGGRVHLLTWARD